MELCINMGVVVSNTGISINWSNPNKAMATEPPRFNLPLICHALKFKKGEIK
jgi:hypothetical protein